VSLFTLETRGGLRAHISDYGGTLVGLEVPDASGAVADVALGFATLDGAPGASYLPGHPYLGALIGRVSNRIAGARFSLDGVDYALAANHGRHQLHGGPAGFDRRVWASQPLLDDAGPVLALTLLSPNGDQGFPGTLLASAVYRVLEPAVLRLELSATSDRPTPVSLTNHAYLNLAGHDAGDVLGHELTLFADAYTPTDEALIPTGEILRVDGTAFDLRTPAPIGERLDAPELRRLLGGGYDTNVVVRGSPGLLRPAARVRDPSRGRVLEVWSTHPGLQVYSGNLLDGTLVGKGGARYARHAGLALEPQGFPNAVNTPHFPSVWLRPGRVARHVIEYRFGAEASAA